MSDDQITEQNPGEDEKEFYLRVAERHEAALRQKERPPVAVQSRAIKIDATSYIEWREPGED